MRYIMLLLSLCIAAGAQAAQVTLTVLSPGGTPVAGARVLAMTSLLFAPGDARHAQQLTTDNTGKVVITLTPEQTDEQGNIGSATVMAHGMAPVGIPLRPGANIARLALPGQAWGRVVDDAGKPVRGAEVRIVAISRRDLKNLPSLDITDFDWNNPVEALGEGLEHLLQIDRVLDWPETKDKSPATQNWYTARTTADGCWTMQDVPTTGSALVTVKASAPYGNGFGYIPLGPQVQEVAVITVSPGCSVTGKVLSPDGKPAAGVEVLGQLIGNAGTNALPGIVGNPTSVVEPHRHDRGRRDVPFHRPLRE